VFAQVLGKLEQISQELIPGALEPQRAVELFNDAARAERLCTAIKSRLARRVEESKVWRESGHRSAAHWVAEATGGTVGAAARTLETARALETLPETDAAFRAGELSDVQAAEITSTAVADPSAEAELLEAAGTTGVKGLRDRCREVRAGAEGDDQAWARRLHVNRRAHEWTDPDGAYRLEARLAPDAGARFSSAWKAHTDRIFCDARRAGRREPRAAYAADALVALASEGPCKPVEVRVTVDSAALSRGHSKPGERCEIDRVGPMPVTTARALLDDAAVTVMTRSGDDITAVSRPTRTIPTKRRRALEARYPVCGARGCANDQFLEIDHIVPIAEHGCTEIENLWRLCSHHHRLKTYAGWKVLGQNGERDLVPP
jgi:5-methylcytosine-specific restriction endonuclease McrA